MVMPADAPSCYLPYRQRVQHAITDTVTTYSNIATAQYLGSTWAATHAPGPGDPSPPSGDEMWVLKLTNNSITGPKPKLFIKADPGAILSVGAAVDFCRRWPVQTEVSVRGIHFLQEDAPDEIGRAIAEWLMRLG